MSRPNFRQHLISQISHYRLDQKRPAQTKTQTDWPQIKVMAEHGVLSEDMCRSLLFTLNEDIEHFQDFVDVLHRHPEPDQLYSQGKPQVRLGEVSDAPQLEFGIRDDKPVFICCAGVTGSGKSNALRALITNIHGYNQRCPDKKISVIAMNRKGTDFADLALKFGWKHFHVPKTFRMSLENPPGMSPNAWVNIVADLFCSRAGLNYSRTTLVAAISTLLGLLNPNPGSRLIWPDFGLVLEFLSMLPETYFSTKADYTRSLKQQLRALCMSTTADTFRAFQGFQVEQLIRNRESVIITAPNLYPGWASSFLGDMLICQSLKPRMENLQRENHVRAIFVLEEADNDVDARREQLFSDSMTPSSELFKKGREFGLAGCLSVSSLKNVSTLIKENTTTHLMFKPNDPTAAAIAAETLMLPRYGELTLSGLKVGQCIAKQVGPWPHAMKVEIDHMPVGKFNGLYDRHSFMPSVKITDIPAVMKFIENVRNKKQSPSTNTNLSPVAKKSRQLMDLAADYRYYPVKLLFEKMGKPHHKTQKAIRKYLQDHKWAKFEEPRIGRKNLLLMDLTLEGYKAINKSPPKGNNGRGSLTHISYQHWIKLSLQNKSFNAKIEAMIEGTNHPADVIVSLPNNRCVVFEICISSHENLLSHIKTCFEKSISVDELIVVASTKKELEKIKKNVYSGLGLKHYTEKIKFESIVKYIPERI